MKEEVRVFRKRLGKRIAQLRKKKGLDQIGLAAIMDGKDKQTINRYERYGANPTAFILVEIAKALGVSLDQLVDFSELHDASEDD
ncbi:helix-turn-helix domain-containing protein [Pedobacter deserti]|uniref:helix-turn-helix domain-containing protein n=1 Tax=Pedobacter deserti TaxID=2817382 RepID=UPI00210C021C|nr:helix-turn-helix transcriptional regulator [Pedobacter sp. SYSU D00382]